MMGVEPMTSSLPRKCSTPELHRQNLSGRRNSNPRPLAWKANALPTELLPLNFPKKVRLEPSIFIKCRPWFFIKVGRAGFEPTKSYDSRVTVCPSWPLWYLPVYKICHCQTYTYNIFHEPMKGFEPPTCWLQISCSDQLSYIGNLKNAPRVYKIPSKNGLQMYEFIFYLSK